VKLKRDFTFLLHVDQHPDLIVARPAARATYSVTATLYAPIHSSYSSSTVLEPAHSTLARPGLHPDPIDRYGALTVTAASAMAETAGMGETYAVIAATHAKAEAVVEPVADYPNTTPGGVETMAELAVPAIVQSIGAVRIAVAVIAKIIHGTAVGRIVCGTHWTGIGLCSSRLRSGSHRQPNAGNQQAHFSRSLLRIIAASIGDLPHSLNNSNVGDRRTVCELNGVRFGEIWATTVATSRSRRAGSTT